MTIFPRLANRFHLADWTQRLGGAAMEQAVFAGSNFLLNIYLARELGSEGYGAFAFAYAWFLLVLNLYDAFVIEPMAIFGAKTYYDSLDLYLGFLFSSHALVGGLAAFLLGCGAIAVNLFGAPSFQVAALAGAAAATPFLLLRWLTRQPFFISGRPAWAAGGGLIYFFTSLLVMNLFSYWHWLVPASAMLAMGIASLISAAVLTMFRLDIAWNFRGRLAVRDVLRVHWQYGKWAWINKLLAWVPINGFYVLLPSFATLSDTGALRAASNLTLPAHMLVTAMMSVLMPSFARTLNRQGPGALAHRVRIAFLGFLGLTSALGLVVSFAGAELMHLFYRGRFDQYSSFAFYAALALQPIVAAPLNVFDVALRVLGGVKWTFVSSILPAILAPVLGILLYQKYDLTGVAFAAVIPQMAFGVVTYYFYRRELRRAVADSAARQPEPVTP